jgi:hypothetical protein
MITDRGHVVRGVVEVEDDERGDNVADAPGIEADVA